MESVALVFMTESTYWFNVICTLEWERISLNIFFASISFFDTVCHKSVAKRIETVYVDSHCLLITSQRCGGPMGVHDYMRFVVKFYDWIDNLRNRTY